MIAIIPAAGLGTRMAALTGGAPKELLPLGHRSVLRRVIDEAISAETDEVVVVSSHAKPQIEEIVTEWRRDTGDVRLRVAYQSSPLGLADALFAAEVEDDVLVLLGDCVYRGGSPVDRMATLVFRGMDGCIAVEQVPDEETRRYGICEIDDMGGIRRIVEKPAPDETSSRWAVAARYAFAAPVLGHLEELYLAARLQQPTGEVNLSGLMHQAIQNGVDLKAIALQPGQERVDCGTPEEYAEAHRLPWD
jgi:dTDP-glucose pyrophosphorylase